MSSVELLIGFLRQIVRSNADVEKVFSRLTLSWFMYIYSEVNTPMGRILLESKIHQRYQRCQLVEDRQVGFLKWKSLCLSQHRTEIYSVINPMDWIVVELEAHHCCQLVADREVFLLGWKSCS